MRYRTPLAVVVAVALATLLSGCFTGERPEFEDEAVADAVPTALTGNADIDAVLSRLDAVGAADFTATYEITTKFGALDSVATVVHAADGRLAVVVDRAAATTRFLDADGSQTTCNTVTSECESRLNDARISDVGIPHTFYAPSFATRLRVSADRRIGGASGYDETIAGQPARCVDVTVAGGTETFCALASGALGRFVGNDVTATLTSYEPLVDTAAFAPV